MRMDFTNKAIKGDQDLWVERKEKANNSGDFKKYFGLQNAELQNEVFFGFEFDQWYKIKSPVRPRVSSFEGNETHGQNFT